MVKYKKEIAFVTALPPSTAFAWEDHHFVAGSTALDFANAVVYRLDKPRREDRFRTPADVNAWARAAGLAAAPIAGSELDEVLAARDAIDAYFRAPPERGGGKDWQRLVRFYARQVAGIEEKPLPRLLAIIVHEAVALRFSPAMARVKTCSGCGWLFVDRTRNNSKRWCIAALCGNRDKARRHYHRKKLSA